MSCNTGSVLFLGDFVNPQQQLWASYNNENGGAANLQVSSLTVNAFPTGNIVLQSLSNAGVEYNAPLLFQRPSGDINAPFEGLVMNTSLSVPTYPVNGEFITAVKGAGTAYDDIAVKGLQIYGNQTTTGNAGARGYITGDATGVSINSRSLITSSITVSSIFVDTVVSTTTGFANSYTASLFMSTPVLFTDTLNAKNAISTNGINNLTGNIVCAQGNVTAIGNNSRMIIGPGAPYPTVTINPSTISCATTVANLVQTSRAVVNFNLRATGLSSVTVSTTSIAANLGTFSTISVRNLSTTFVSSVNIRTDFMDVTSVAQIQGLGVVGETFLSTMYANEANISTANISSIAIGNFSATTIDTDTLSSLTSQVNISLISTLQLKADVGISPNIDLGLGGVIGGMIGGASAQGLAVAIGGAGLATGATALITGRQSGGVNNTVFQTVNGSTQLQFSTIGAPTTSVFLNTDSADPLHAPGNLTQISQLVPAGTYCVRSVGDPLNVDSATQGIQMFGQWVPVVQPTATIARVAISTLTTSTINSATATISSLTVSSFNLSPMTTPSTLFASTISYTGSLIGTNPIAPLSWSGPAVFPSQLATKDLGFINAFGTVVSVLRTNTDNNLVWNYPSITMLSGPPATAVSSMIFNANGTVNMLSTLRVRDISLSNAIRFGPASTGNPYISTSTDIGEQEAIFYGGSTMTLQADETMRLVLGPFNPFVFNNYDSPSPGCAVNLNASPMTFTGNPTIGNANNFATFTSINVRFNQSTIMRGPYNGVSTIAISSLTNNVSFISSLTVSSINTPDNIPVGTPTGAVMIWSGGSTAAPTLPVGWLLCDGSEYPQTTYPALYAVVGTTYQRTTPTAGNFFVPDLRFTFPMSPHSLTPPATGMVNPPIGTAYSRPTNLGYPGVVANQIWTFTGLSNGVLVPGMAFAARGPGGAAAFIDRMIDGNGDVGSYIMTSLNVGTWPVLGSVGSPVTVSPVAIGTGANFPYKIGTYNASGYNSNPTPATTQIYRWGQNINGSNVGVAGTTANTFGGVTNSYATPTAAGNLSFQTAPNFINMFYIIKY